MAGAGAGAGARGMDRGTNHPGTDRERNDSQSKDPSDRNRSRPGSSRRMTLPPEYADFILEDGRRLEDVLGKSFFQEGGKLGRFGLFGRDARQAGNGVRARVLAERRAQARRLNQTRSILTGAQGVAGAANTSRSDLSGG